MVPSYAIRGVTHTATHLSKQKKHTLICTHLLQLCQEGRLVSQQVPEVPQSIPHSTKQQEIQMLRAAGH